MIKKCKCYANYYGDVIYCPKHEAVDDLYEALLTALGIITLLDNGKEYVGETVSVIRQALAKVEEKK